jgi:thiosulfate/3-mercaptopyruvate sulfurtransferase
MWTTLVSASELLSRQSSADLRILDCRHQLTNPAWGPDEYAKAHIPGAVHAHIDRDLSSKPTPQTGRHPLPDPSMLRDRFSTWGIDESVQVVVYDDQGGVWAARAWWLLQDYGHKAVALLDGGLQAWTHAGGRLTHETPSIPRRNFAGTPGHRPEIHATALVHATANGQVRPLDARAPERYRGEMEPIDPVAGHIPGARNLPAVSLLDKDKRFLPIPRLRERLQEAAGGRKPEELAAYCGSGVTGCHLVLAYEAAGLGSIRLYPGSWSEWIRDPKRPVAKGDDPDHDAGTAHV